MPQGDQQNSRDPEAQSPLQPPPPGTQTPRPGWLAGTGNWLRLHLTDAQRFYFLCIITGVLCGLAAVAFHVSIHWTFDSLWHLLAPARNEGAFPHGTLTFALLMPLVPALGGLIAGIILYRFAPTASGSGIPQTKAAYYNRFGIIKLKEGFYRFILGVIFVGSGNSLGREGPTVHMCAAIASSIGQWFGLAKARIQAMVPVGFGAGIAAAFNAPISGITFVFEELLGDFSSKALGGIIVAVVIAAAVERTILGEHPVFDTNLPHFETEWWMLVAIPLGLASALLGHAFVMGLLWMRGRFLAWKQVPPWIKPALGGLMVGIMGTTVFLLTRAGEGQGFDGIFSIGYNNLDDALNARLLWWAFLLLMVGKFLASIISYAAGGSGGLFSPALFTGAMLGGLFGSVLRMLFPELDIQVVGACALLGMGSFFAATIRCPITSILIIFEMTQNYSLILPLMAGNILAYFIAARLKAVPIYDALLLQDRVTLRRMPSYQGAQDYRNLPVSTIMTHELETVQANHTAQQALDAITPDHVHRTYPILDAEARLAGIIMHSELAELARSAPNQPLDEWAKKQKLVTITPDTSIRDAAQRLVLSDVEQAPVVGQTDARKLLGLLTLHDIARQQNRITEQMGR